VVTDEQIEAMTPEERSELIQRLARPAEEILPWRGVLLRIREYRLVLMIGSVAVLLPWIVFLAITLPRDYVAHNWDRTWVGFDILLLGMLIATGVLGLLGRQMLSLTAFATGILLICDAWFDVMTSHGVDKTMSLVTALVLELPLAAVLIVGSLQVLRLSAARLWDLKGGRHAWQVPIWVPSHPDAEIRRSRRQAD
jgi:hypothetical protein